MVAHVLDDTVDGVRSVIGGDAIIIKILLVIVAVIHFPRAKNPVAIFFELGGQRNTAGNTLPFPPTLEPSHAHVVGVTAI